MATNFTPAMDDIKWLAKRLGGLLALAENFEEVQKLLNQQDSLAKAVEERGTLLNNVQAELDKTKDAVKAAQTKVNTLSKQAADLEKDMAEKKAQSDAALANAQKAAADVEGSAERYRLELRAKAEKDAADYKEQLAADVKDQEAKLKKLQGQIAKIKESL